MSENPTILMAERGRSYTLYVLMLLSPFIGLILFGVFNWWLSCACMGAYFLQLMFWTLAAAPDWKGVRVKPEEKDAFIQNENKVLNVQIALLLLAAVLDLFPFFVMNGIAMRAFSYTPSILEGGIVASITSILMFVLLTGTAVMLKPRAKKESAHQIVRFEEREIRKVAEAQPKKDWRKDRLEREIALYGEEYEVISRPLRLYINYKRQILYAQGNVYLFKDIQSFTVEDHPTSVYTETEPEIRINHRNLVGKTFLGKIIGGKTGAVLGAISAIESVEVPERKSEEVHDYTIHVQTNRILEITLHTGKDQNLTNQICSVLKGILKS